MESFIGEIRLFSGPYTPVDWIPCDGRALPISDNQVLYSLIGTTYGGNGVTTFNVPDLRGRLPIGRGNGVNLTARAIGQAVGATEVALSVGTLATHQHQMTATTAAAAALAPTTGSMFAAPAANAYSAGTAPVALHDAALTPTGGSQPHPNTMPCTAMNYIICAVGLYPTRP